MIYSATSIAKMSQKMSHRQQEHIVIIGGGLSGLYLAYRLSFLPSPPKITILEARSRLGGRLFSAQATLPDAISSSSSSDGFDLGGSWIWPSTQTQLAALIEELGLETFDQHEEGDVLIERSQTRSPQRLDPQSLGMGGAKRLRGGMASLINALETRLEGKSNVEIVLNAFVKEVHREGSGVKVVCLDTSCTCNIVGDKVVLALPPRLAAHHIKFSPSSLPSTYTASWSNTATWMASSAKYVAVYSTPFWRSAGLCGNAHSTSGPLGEVHDASNFDASLGALFGFFSLSPSVRHASGEEDLKAACRNQLVRLFGKEAASPISESILDWAAEEYTATAEDVRPTNPINGGRKTQLQITPEDKEQSEWNNVVYGAGAEWSSKYPGYIAGAIDAAEQVFAAITAEAHK